MGYTQLATRFRNRLNRFFLRAGFPRNWWLIPLAAFIGSASGLAAQGYGYLVTTANGFFYGSEQERNLAGGAVWLIMALPALGALIVGLIKWAFRLPLISHGVPDVMEALARRGGKMRWQAGVFAAVNSAITIGSGGSAGQEGPIIHIGSVVGSVIGQLLRASREHMDTLIGCGAAAGLAAIFKAPIAGVLLVLEVLLRDFSPRTLMPVVVASVFGVTVAQGLADAGYGGTHEEGALFQMPAAMLDYHFTYHEILPYLALGIGCGLVGWLFARSLTLSEEFWHRRPWPMIVKPVIGGLLLGLIGVCFRLGFGKVFTHYGPPPFFGNGYPAIEAMLDPAAYLGPDAMVAARLTLIYLAVLTAAKIIGTSLTLGSGASGGTFAPCLFIGAAFGGAYGSALRDLAWVGPVGPAAYALAGMAGVLSAAVHCPLTAFVLVFEITGDYKVILPVMLVTVSATVVNQLLMRESIYTATLREMGVRVDRLNELTLLRRIEVSAVPLGPAVIVRPHDSGQQLVEAARDSATADVIVCGEDRKYLGIVLAHDLRTALLEREAVPLVVASDLMRTDVPTVTPSETLDSVFDKFTRFDTASLAVVGEGGRVLGVITRARLIRHYEKTAEES